MKLLKHVRQRPGEAVLVVPHDQLPALAVACEDARALGADHDGVITELLSCLCDYLGAPLPTVYAFGQACEAIPSAEPAPVITGPGGDFRRAWPPDASLTREAIGGDARSAIAEALPIVRG